MTSPIHDPTPELPDMGFAPEDPTLTPWSEAEAALTVAASYWLATTRPDGRPHVMPVWGIWMDRSFYFSTAATSRKGQNLAANPSCTVSLAANGLDLVIDGAAEPVTAEAVLQRVAALYAPKYDWPLTVRDGGIYGQNGDGGPVYVLKPVVVYAFGAAEGFTATRWRMRRSTT